MEDTVTSRQTMLGLLDPAATDPAGHARAATATVTHLEQLAQRYQALHATADPAALLTPVAARPDGDAVMTTDDCELLDEGTP